MQASRVFEHLEVDKEVDTIRQRLPLNLGAGQGRAALPPSHSQTRRLLCPHLTAPERRRLQPH